MKLNLVLPLLVLFFSARAFAGDLAKIDAARLVELKPNTYAAKKIKQVRNLGLSLKEIEAASSYYALVLYGDIPSNTAREIAIYIGDEKAQYMHAFRGGVAISIFSPEQLNAWQGKLVRVVLAQDKAGLDTIAADAQVPSLKTQAKTNSHASAMSLSSHSPTGLLTLKEYLNRRE